MNENSSFSKIVKRNGEICDFKAEKIEQAIFKASEQRETLIVKQHANSATR